MKKLTFSLIILVLSIFFTSTSRATEGEMSFTDHVNTRLITSHISAKPGDTIQIGWELNMQPHWHIYWKNPGDSGLPPAIKWAFPGENFHIGKPKWPTPITVETPPIMNYGYKNTIILTYPLTIPQNWPVGKPIYITASTQFLVCKDVCLPGEANVSLTQPTSSSSVKNNSIKDYMLNQPFPQKTTIIQKATKSPTHFTLYLQTNAKTARFIPFEEGILKDIAPQPYKNNTLTIERDSWNNLNPNVLEGLVLTNEGAFVITEPLEPVATTQNNITLPLAILFAFIAGLILNLMPCVMPVLALKVLSLIKHAHGKIFAHTVTFTLGILTLFWLMAFTIAGLKSAGQTVGWGFHLQNPIIVASLTALMLIIALNFFGIFNVGNSIVNIAGKQKEHKGFVGSFFAGTLITLLATPCTVPFMGGAIAYALTTSTLSMFIIFTAMGLGLATPYLLLTTHPKLLKKLPKPGAWINTFKQFLGFPMLATALWLLWVFSNQVSANTTFMFLISLLVISFGFWFYGLQQKRHSRYALFVLVLSLFISYAITNLGLQKEDATIKWKIWSQAEVKREHNAGKTVFVVFTADWCVTCKVTEALVIETKKMKRLFEKHNVSLFKADWTKYNPEITKALEKHGRKGVPLYLLYLPEKKEPFILPQLLTYGTVKEKLSQ